MRWPLRNQILGPLLLLLLATVGILSGLNFRLASAAHQQRLEEELSEVGKLLSNSSFPLSASVLQNMKSLSGADFVVMRRDGTITATTLPQPLDADLHTQLEDKPLQDSSGLGPMIQIGSDRYYHRVAQNVRQRMGTNDTTLHLLLREDSYRQLWWQSVWPSLLVGLIALPIVALVAAGLAAVVTRPLGRLRRQVEQVADGHWEPLDLGQRNDEIRDLSEAVNRMAEQLKAYEEEVRTKERLETLVDLGSGIAHHLRNSSTGCRMAIQLSQLGNGLPADTQENLQVALRQLALMDKYIQRFLSLDPRSPSGRSEGAVDWCQVIGDVLELLGPSARHLGVRLKASLPQTPVKVNVPLDDLEQVVMNLVTNALDAAAQRNEEQKNGEISEVLVDFQATSPYAHLSVWDSGCGPPDDIRDNLFHSFVTRKKNGVGLGLYLTRQIVSRFGGQVGWKRTVRPQVVHAPGDRNPEGTERDPEGTCFEVHLPLASG